MAANTIKIYLFFLHFRNPNSKLHDCYKTTRTTNDVILSLFFKIQFQYGTSRLFRRVPSPCLYHIGLPNFRSENIGFLWPVSSPLDIYRITLPRGISISLSIRINIREM